VSPVSAVVELVSLSRAPLRKLELSLMLFIWDAVTAAFTQFRGVTQVVKASLSVS
jgi:hypothetical protein